MDKVICGEGSNENSRKISGAFQPSRSIFLVTFFLEQIKNSIYYLSAEGDK